MGTRARFIGSTLARVRREQGEAARRGRLRDARLRAGERGDRRQEARALELRGRPCGMRGARREAKDAEDRSRLARFERAATSVWKRPRRAARGFNRAAATLGFFFDTQPSRRSRCSSWVGARGIRRVEEGRGRIATGEKMTGEVSRSRRKAVARPGGGVECAQRRPTVASSDSMLGGSRAGRGRKRVATNG